MRWNPCGKAVDLGSRPFKCKYRPFRDSDQEVEIEWFPCAPGAELLPWVSNVSNPFWEEDQFEFTDGTLPLDTVIPTGKPRSKPGSGKGHVCGTEGDFANGGLYQPALPPVAYGMQGLPSCCNPAVVGRGGVLDGGRSLVLGFAEPAQSCVTATPLPLDTPTGIIMIPNRVYWLRVPKLGLTELHLRWQTVTGTPPIGCFANEGNDCSLLFFGGSWTTPGCSSKFPTPSLPFAWVSISTFGGGGGKAILTAGAGPC
jgi:hypothetical protein